MNAPHDLDRRLDDWLRDGPSRAPERTIVAALDHARAHPRRRDPLAILRRDPMGSTGFGSGSGLRVMPLVAALGLLLVAALAVATIGGPFQRQPVVVPPLETPSPSATATPEATPSLSPVATPSPSTIRVDLVDDIGGNAFIEITDLSGTLVKARSGQESEGGPVEGDIGVFNAPGDPATVVLMWVGCPSDTRYVMTIAADGRTMSIDQPVCQGDTLGVARVLVLTFDGPVPASEVQATIRIVGG